MAFGVEGEVDDHDAVLLDDADEQDDADDGDDVEIEVEELEGEEGADAGGRQGGEDGDGVDVALLEDAEDDVDGDEGGEDEEAFVGLGAFEGGGRALVIGDDGGGELGLVYGFVNAVERLAEGVAVGEVEADRDGGELALMIDGESFVGGLEVHEGAERDGVCGGRSVVARP